MPLSARRRERSPLLVLFEPQGTLLLDDGSFVFATLQEALEDIYAVAIEGAPIENFRAGGTSWQSCFSLLRQAGVSEEGVNHHKDVFLDYAAELYRLRASEDPARDRVHWQARPLLEDLRGRGCLLGFVSPLPFGVERTRLLESGLLDLLSDSWAAADDVRYHTDLYPVARRRAAAEPWPRERTVAVGAQPSLVCRAHSDPIGAICVVDPSEERRYLSADHLVHSLDELQVKLERYQPRYPFFAAGY